MEITTNMTSYPADSQVQKFYDGKKVFITGGTGFLGKLLVEKLLRSTNVSAIYFLIRPKKGKNVYTRLDEYFDDAVFQKLKTEVPKYKSKIVGIPGDCALAGLGLTIEDRQLLIDNVNIVFHVAATVNFMEKLSLAYSINVKAVEVILNLCRQMRNLKACIHVSTVYAHCHNRTIDEVFYETAVNSKDLEGILSKLDDESIERLTPKIIGKSPNTYTFTKALAETLIKEGGYGLPIGVFRPSIVISTYKEPLEAWIDNMYGPTGICVGVASGVIRTICCNAQAVANVVPADTCVACLIVAAWDVASKFSNRESTPIPIYNYSSTNENPISWIEFHMLSRLSANIYPMSTSIWSLCFDSTSSRTVYNIKKLFYHLLPGTVLDILAVCTGRKPRLIKLYSKVHKFLEVLSYFSMKEWDCRNDNVIKMWNKMNQSDKELFPFSMTLVHWTTFFQKYMLGVRKYLLKDSDQTLAKSRAKMLKLNILHNTMKFIITVSIFNVIWESITRNIGNWKPIELL